MVRPVTELFHLRHHDLSLFFLDYFATGHLETETATRVVKGICDGCKMARCALIGGETAEMPSLYAPGEYDLAGFAVGAVKKQNVLPKPTVPGMVVLGLPSSGPHVGLVCV